MNNVIKCLCVILLFSCGSTIRDYNFLYGKWNFDNYNGLYSEMWINKDSILIGEDDGNVRVFTYRIEADSLILITTSKGREYIIDSAYVKELSNEKLILVNPSFEIELKRLTHETPNFQAPQDYKPFYSL